MPISPIAPKLRLGSHDQKPSRPPLAPPPVELVAQLEEDTVIISAQAQEQLDAERRPLLKDPS